MTRKSKLPAKKQPSKVKQFDRKIEKMIQNAKDVWTSVTDPIVKKSLLRTGKLWERDLRS